MADLAPAPDCLHPVWAVRRIWRLPAVCIAKPVRVAGFVRATIGKPDDPVRMHHLPIAAPATQRLAVAGYLPGYVL